MGVARGGRPSKGAAAKTVSGSVRLTPHEAEVLEAHFGGVPTALRRLVDNYWASNPYFRSTKSVPSTPNGEPAPQDEPGEPATS